jgi:hypothetical protein
MACKLTFAVFAVAVRRKALGCFAIRRDATLHGPEPLTLSRGLPSFAAAPKLVSDSARHPCMPSVGCCASRCDAVAVLRPDADRCYYHASASHSPKCESLSAITHLGAFRVAHRESHNGRGSATRTFLSSPQAT